MTASDGPRLIEHASFWTLPVHGAVVVALELTDGDGSMGRFDVEVDPVSLGPALPPAKATVRDAVAEKGGALRVRFDDGTSLQFRWRTRFEPGGPEALSRERPSTDRRSR